MKTKVTGIIAALIVLLTLVACVPVAPVVTEECTDATQTSLMAHATVIVWRVGLCSGGGSSMRNGRRDSLSLHLISRSFLL